MTQQDRLIAQNPNPDPNITFKMLNNQQNQNIKSVIDTQTQAPEKMTTQKLITTLSTLTTNRDRFEKDLQQKNLRLQNHLNDLTKQVRNTIAASSPATWTPTPIVTMVPPLMDIRVTVTASERQTPRQAMATKTIAPVYFQSPSRPTAIDVKLSARPDPSMATVAAS